MIRSLFTLFTLGWLSVNAADPTWPQFRGPNGDGIAEGVTVPKQFDKNTNLDWRTPLAGKGWSSPVVSGNSIWLTSAIEEKPSEADRKKLLEESGVKPGKIKVKQIATTIRLIIIEVDLNTGEVKQEIELAKIAKPDSIHNLNSYASPTPCLDGDRLYAHFGTYGTYCFDTAQTKVLWQDRQPVIHGVGPGSSPVIHGDHLIMIYDAVDQQYVTALDKYTGKEVWKTERPEMRSDSGDRRKAYSTPTIITPTNGKDQAICLGAQWIVSYDPSSGKENWRVDHGDGFSVIPRPVFSQNHQLIYFISGFPKPVLWAINPEGATKWKESKRIPAKPSPILVEDEIYIITDAGIVSCLDAATGESHWSERLDGNYSASPLLASGNLYFCNHEGEINVFSPGKTPQPITNNQIDEQIMASPIAVNDQLIIRSADALYSFKTAN